MSHDVDNKIQYKKKKKPNKENVYSRANKAFRTEELVARFNREYIFKDKAGLSFTIFFRCLSSKSHDLD